MRLCNSRRHGEHCAGRNTDQAYLAPVIIRRVEARRQQDPAETTTPLQPLGKHCLTEVAS